MPTQRGEGVGEDDVKRERKARLEKGADDPDILSRRERVKALDNHVKIKEKVVKKANKRKEAGKKEGRVGAVKRYTPKVSIMAQLHGNEVKYINKLIEASLKGDKKMFEKLKTRYEELKDRFAEE